MISVPIGWSYEPLTKFIDSRSGNGKLIKGKQSSESIEGFVPAFSASGQDIWTEKADFFGDGIVVSAVGARCGKAFLAGGSWTAVANTHVLQIKQGAELDIKYLWYLCNDENWWLRSGTAQPFVKVKDTLERLQLLPPIDEQHQIVEVLQDHLSRLEAALADVKQAKIKAAQFRKSLLQSIFEGRYSSKSDTWEHRAIGDFAEVKGGKRLPKGTKWSGETTLHPYIRATDIKFGKINDEDLVHVPDSVWNSIARYVVEENDVVITIAGTIGEVAVVPPNLAGANLTENAAKLVFDHEYVMPSYLSMYLQSPSVQQEFKELSRATTQAKLALYRIATVEIPVPTLQEQQKMMELVDEKLTFLTHSLNQISAIELNVPSLRRSLLQAAFTGQLTKEVSSV